ncbi:hypothetical protein ES288_A10G130400v1 [Gossypium darwinii]|uniref:Uncharacterized protein n=1 Tax=Gossypium darwinii TaxID=34276 RepID=A0A5D2EYK4_GOSDA|nr:hypothetical protein ES288_A10G130400v1 [Gossypium darwinii]
MHNHIPNNESHYDNFIQIKEKKKEFKSYLWEIIRKTPLQERGFESLLALNDETQEIVHYHKWEKLCKLPIESASILVVQEFYATNIDTYKIVEVLTNGISGWKHHLRTDYRASFLKMEPSPKVSLKLQCISSRIFPVVDMSNINTFQATLLYAILQTGRIYVLRWIYRSMICCVRKAKVELLFPHLVTVLCKRAKVPIGHSRCVLQPIKNSIKELVLMHPVED